MTELISASWVDYTPINVLIDNFIRSNSLAIVKRKAILEAGKTGRRLKFYLTIRRYIYVFTLNSGVEVGTVRVKCLVQHKDCPRLGSDTYSHSATVSPKSLAIEQAKIAAFPVFS